MASTLMSGAGEKVAATSPTTRLPPRDRKSWFTGRRVWCLLLLTLLWLPWNSSRGVLNWQQYPRGRQTVNVDDPFGSPDWSKIKPSEKLVWHPCYSGLGSELKCARLTVPMDYNRPLNESNTNPKVHLALVLSPAPGRAQDPASFGETPLMVNPGGPGGSGAFFVAAAHDVLRNTVAGDHDILGFDPRGIAASTPRADCFQSPDIGSIPGDKFGFMNRLTWLVGAHEVGLVNSSQDALVMNEARSRALTQLCKGVSDTYGNESIFSYVNTANVAQDMLSIIEAWDVWRSESTGWAKRIKAGRDAEMVDPLPSKLAQTAKADGPQRLRGKLVYWGFSYGTIVGGTFISMFPDRVGRVILDGVVDMAKFARPDFMHSLVDADKVLHEFFTQCYKEKGACPLYRPGDDAQSIENRYHEILASLQNEPRVVIEPGINLPVILTASDIKYLIFTALYLPGKLFTLVAYALNAIWIGLPLQPFVSFPILGAACGNLSLPVWPDDSGPAVRCSDMEIANETTPELQKRFEDMTQVSSFADVLFGLFLPCNGWGIEAIRPPRWNDRPVKDPITVPIQTSFPVLLLSNRLDPVTPLRSALAMTRQLANASIVEQHASGHCSLACTSLCTQAHIRAYLNEGRLPPPPRFDDNDGDGESGEWPTCECDGGAWGHEMFGGDVGGSSTETSTTWDDDKAPYTAQEGRWMQNWDSLREQLYPILWKDFLGEKHPLRIAVASWMGASRAHVGGAARCESSG